MRIPAEAIAVAFCGGILLGRGLHLTLGVLGISFFGIFFLLIAALLFAWRQKLWGAAIFSVVGWVWLGAIGMVLASRPLPAEHALSRFAEGQIELKTPLSWHGHLRNEPARPPWGVGLEMELSGVETAAGMIPVLDVAQGDSMLVISPKGSTLLIDGGRRFAGFRGHEEVPGPDPGEEAVSAYLWSRRIQKLDAVALTHAHQDHIGGLRAVLENFQVGRL